MSILQEYEEIRKELGNGINKGIELYLSENPNLLLSDIYYKEKEYKKFEKWFENYLKPFMTLECKISLILIGLFLELEIKTVYLVMVMIMKV